MTKVEVHAVVNSGEQSTLVLELVETCQRARIHYVLEEKLCGIVSRYSWRQDTSHIPHWVKQHPIQFREQRVGIYVATATQWKSPRSSNKVTFAFGTSFGVEEVNIKRWRFRR